jgi:hypothetical protein
LPNACPALVKRDGQKPSQNKMPKKKWCLVRWFRFLGIVTSDRDELLKKQEEHENEAKKGLEEIFQLETQIEDLAKKEATASAQEKKTEEDKTQKRDIVSLKRKELEEAQKAFLEAETIADAAVLDHGLTKSILNSHVRDKEMKQMVRTKHTKFARGAKELIEIKKQEEVLQDEMSSLRAEFKKQEEIIQTKVQSMKKQGIDISTKIVFE